MMVEIDYESTDTDLDRYFEPDDPAIWNPDSFSPQQRFRNFLGLYYGKAHSHHPPSSTSQQHHRPLIGHHKESGITIGSPAATRYLFMAAATSGNKDTPPIHPESIPVLKADYLASLTGNSSSSAGEECCDQEVKQSDDDESCGCSLSYSVESERCAGRRDEYPLYRNGRPHLNGDLYEDIMENNNRHLNLPFVPADPKTKSSIERVENCFQPSGGEIGEFECFQVFAWIGELFWLWRRDSNQFLVVEDSTR